MVFLELVVVIIGVGPELQFLHLDHVLFFLGFVLLFFLFVLPLPVIHGFCHWRLGSWGDEDQIEAQILCAADGRLRRHDLDEAIRKNRPYFSGANRFVHILSYPGTAWRKISWWVHSLSKRAW